MTIVAREAQILRVRAQGIHPDLNEKLSEALSTTVIAAVKTVMEGALPEEVTEFLAQVEGEKPPRSGFYARGLDTQYGTISDLQVPKLRQRNAEREWQILERYQRSLGNLLDWLCCLYVMGLSLRDLQEASYFLLGRVRPIGECRESDYPSSATEIRRKAPSAPERDTACDSGGWGLGGHSVRDCR